MNPEENDNITTLSQEEKKRMLFKKQKMILDLFLERNAISKDQYNKSLGDLIAKMGIDLNDKG